MTARRADRPDRSLPVVPGAIVLVTNTATGQRRDTVSSRDGVFAAAGLPPGDYRIDVALPGFKTLTHGGLHVVTGETARVDVQLATGDVREQVTVAAAMPALRTETASLASVVGRDRVASR